MAHLGKVGTEGGAGQGGERFSGAGGGEGGDQRGKGGQHFLAVGRPQRDKADGGGDQLGGKGLQEDGEDVLRRQLKAAGGVADGDCIGQRWGLDPGQDGDQLAEGGALVAHFRIAPG